MAREAVVGFLHADIFLIRRKQSIEKKCSERGSRRSEKTVLHAGALKESKLSLSYMARRTFSSGRHRQADQAIFGRERTIGGIPVMNDNINGPSPKEVSLLA
jgi:hypothetical protein